jgi:hypothetical protein
MFHKTSKQATKQKKEDSGVQVTAPSTGMSIQICQSYTSLQHYIHDYMKYGPHSENSCVCSGCSPIFLRSIKKPEV